MSSEGDYYEVWICESHGPGRLEGTPDTDNCPWCEIARLREDLANLDHAILSKIDPGAAGSTDLYTWAKCKTAEIVKLREENERPQEDLAEAVSILYECSTLSAHYDQTRKRLRSFLRRQDPDA